MPMLDPKVQTPNESRSIAIDSVREPVQWVERTQAVVVAEECLLLRRLDLLVEWATRMPVRLSDPCLSQARLLERGNAENLREELVVSPNKREDMELMHVVDEEPVVVLHPATMEDQEEVETVVIECETDPADEQAKSNGR